MIPTLGMSRVGADHARERTCHRSPERCGPRASPARGRREELCGVTHPRPPVPTVGEVKVRQRTSTVGLRLPSIAQVSDPGLRAYFGSRWNWLAMLVTTAMLAVTWPILGEVLRVPGYVLPVLAVVSVVPLLGVAAGPRPILAGWCLIVVACAITAPLTKHFAGADLRVAVPQFLVLIAMTVAALVTQPLRRLPAVWLVTALALLISVRLDNAAGWIFGLTVLAISAAFARYWFSSRREIAVQTEQTELAQAREEVLAERSRIARELHDIVAHRMSMVVVMSQTAPYRLAAAVPPVEVAPAVAAEFDAIAGAARESLDEVRMLLGVLRTDDLRAPARPDGGAAPPPAPGIDDVADLVADAGAAGVAVIVDDATDHAAVGDAAGLVIYRIVQESLSNAARYAPGAPVRVKLTPSDDSAIRVSVVNDRSAAGFTIVDSRRCGLGIRGMRERATALGGRLTADQTEEGGFAVIAVVPASPVTD